MELDNFNEVCCGCEQPTDIRSELFQSPWCSSCNLPDKTNQLLAKLRGITILDGLMYMHSWYFTGRDNEHVRCSRCGLQALVYESHYAQRWPCLEENMMQDYAKAPGVYIQEIDLTIYTTTVSTSVTGEDQDGE